MDCCPKLHAHAFSTITALSPLHLLIVFVLQVLFFLLNSLQLLLVVLQCSHLSIELVIAFSKVLVVATGYLTECMQFV